MNEYVSRIMPYELISPVERDVILALWCNACQAFLREDFWRGEGYFSTEAVVEYHQKMMGNDHDVYLKPTGKKFSGRVIPQRGKCI